MIIQEIDREITSGEWASLTGCSRVGKTVFRVYVCVVMQLQIDTHVHVIMGVGVAGSRVDGRCSSRRPRVMNYLLYSGVPVAKFEAPAGCFATQTHRLELQGEVSAGAAASSGCGRAVRCVLACVYLVRLAV
jgi:hypothetical protein